MKQFIPDYHINLVAPNQIQSFEKFKTELGQTLEFIKYSADTPHFKMMLSKLKNQKLSNETVSVINLFTGAKITLNEKEEVMDVCLAIEEIKQEAVLEATQKVTLEVTKKISSKNAKNLFEKGADYELVRSSIEDLKDEQLKKIYDEVMALKKK